MSMYKYGTALGLMGAGAFVAGNLGIEAVVMPAVFEHIRGRTLLEVWESTFTRGKKYFGGLSAASVVAYAVATCGAPTQDARRQAAIAMVLLALPLAYTIVVMRKSTIEPLQAYKASGEQDAQKIESAFRKWVMQSRVRTVLATIALANALANVLKL